MIDQRITAALLAGAATLVSGASIAEAQTTPSTAEPAGQPLSAQQTVQVAAPSETVASEPGSNAAQPATQAAAQPTQEGDEDEADSEEIVVVGRRDPNAVIGDIPPENTLNSRDVRALGATSISEVLDAIAPQTASSRGRGGGGPIVLLNGKRISGFREIRDLPPEAILRLDILPEEVALKYGYRADQRVVNIVLRSRFRSTTARAEAGLSAGGERKQGEGDVTRLMIGQNGRTSINAHVEDSNRVLESERNIIYDPATQGSVDPRPFRTLIGSRRLARLGGTMNRTLFGDVSSTFDGQIEYSKGNSLLGPSRFNLGDPLQRESESRSAHAGMAFNGQKAPWRWSVTGTYDLSRSETDTDRERTDLGFLTDHARSINRNGALDLVLNGPLATLPAGRANVTLRAGGNTYTLESRATRFGVETRSDLDRQVADASVNVDLPIARRHEFLGAIGNLSLNANAQVEHLSDFGTLTTLGGGAFWSPVERVNLIASYTREEGSPSLAQLGNPVISTPNSRIFDFVTGQNATVESISGGNPSLRSDVRRVIKLGGTARPLEKLDLEMRADYTHTRTRDPISGFPGPTPAIQAAFPDRFQRDTNGNLIRVDLRPVNFESSARDEIRWGFNFTKPLTSARPTQAQIDSFRQMAQRNGLSVPQGQRGGPGGDGGRAAGNRAGSGGGGQGGFRGGGGFGGGRQGGRLQLSVFHTIILKDQVRIAPGLPVLDYLGGEAAEGSSGRSQHRVEINGGYFNNAFGARISANWQSGSLVTGGRSGTLRFTPLTKVNANLFLNAGERFDLVTKHPWLRGTQFRLSLDNIFDARQRVRDAAGFVPVNYQPDYQDPQGRTVRISIRKLFLPPPSFFRRNGGLGGGNGGGRPAR
jgi:hypothetical protein